MENYHHENLSHDPIHGYIPFVAPAQQGISDASQVCERQIIDNPWVQRMRQIRQLQTAWWVFASAEHSRFQHILGVMQLASRAIGQLYDSLRKVDPSVPSLPYVDSLTRMAGLLHDVGHGPFGHFFDEHFLSHFGLTHESLGAHIIETRLGESLRKIRATPAGHFADNESLSPSDIAWLIQRPRTDQVERESKPRWLELLRSLFCGVYTIDNMDFVLRDAFMTGLSPRSFDLDRILHYSQFTERGLTLHDRGIPALVHFLAMKSELFRNVYFHRTVRAIDLELAQLFARSREFLFPGDPRKHLDEYLEFTEFSLLSDVKRWKNSPQPGLSKLGDQWQSWLSRQVPWVVVCQRNVSFSEGQSERSSVFSNAKILRECISDNLPSELANLPFQVDLARHNHRPNTVAATASLNFYYDSSLKQTQPLTSHSLYRRLPISHTIARVYAHDKEHEAAFSKILDDLLGTSVEDDLTNM